jgi:hypothetical protein
MVKHFKVSSNTIKNWRERGLFSCFKAPGSSRILYYRWEVEEFQKKFTYWRKETKKGSNIIDRAKPKLSSNDDWRIS